FWQPSVWHCVLDLGLLVSAKTKCRENNNNAIVIGPQGQKPAGRQDHKETSECTIRVGNLPCQGRVLIPP
uniref:Uncharacterized protein n=1 Tax=Salvator merianae TaxID=96440 RepID=A0A8D0C974_SALMN